MQLQPNRPQVAATLVLVRHGESVWNRSLRFTGWTDIPLTPRGEAQARAAGERLRAAGLDFDLCFTSGLQRASTTLRLLLAAHGSNPPLQQSWRLNERHYGALEGLHPWQAIWRFGITPVWRCRRERHARPPLRPAGDTDERPRGESINDTLARLLPLWRDSIAPALQAGQRVLVVAHNNTLRALIDHLDGVEAGAVVQPQLRTAQPLVLELDAGLRPLRRYDV